MKKLILFIVAAICIQTTSLAQTASAKYSSGIESVLSKLPANNADLFNSQMSEVSTWGKEGLLRMVLMLLAPEQKDNSKLEYAISGYAAYVTKSGNEELRKITVNALCDGLDRLKSKENKAFIMTQLEIIGREDAVDCLRGYLTDDRLSDPAARVLVRINTTTAKSALLDALKQAQGSARITLIEALGDIGHKEAASLIHPFALSEDIALAKVSLYALANIADPSSEQVLAEAAQKAGFIYDVTHAVSSYVQYAQRLAINGHSAQAEKIANDILKKSTFDTGVYNRSAALKILVDIQKEKSIARLLEASVDEQPDYRAAALKFAAPYLTTANTTLWIKRIKDTDSDKQAAIITMLGDNRAHNAYGSILKYLKSKDKQVKLAAIKASGKIGQQQALKSLIKVMKKGDEQDAEAVKNALLVMKGGDVTDVIATRISDMPPYGQTNLIAVLANRAEPDKLKTIYPLLKSKELIVRKAAFASLKKLVTKNDLEKLFTLIHESSDYDDLMEIQSAIIASMKDGKGASYHDLTFQQVEAAPPAKKIYYYKVLAYLGGSKALTMVSEAFKTDNDQIKREALTALTLWSDSDAARELFKISSQTTNDQYFDLAFKGYVRAVSSASYAAEQKFLMLSKAMEIAKTSTQKELVLREIALTKTYPAMILAGKYLDDPVLQQQAGITIMNIALANKSYYGQVVRDLLNRTILVLKGRDGEFQKESIRKHLSEMPAGEPDKVK